jgi:hypothetical protein
MTSASVLPITTRRNEIPIQKTQHEDHDNKNDDRIRNARFLQRNGGNGQDAGISLAYSFHACQARGG